MEFIIEITEGDTVTHVIKVERDLSPSRLKATPAGYSLCTKWKVRDRAEKVAKHIPNAKVVPSFGGYVYSTKSSVKSKNSPINRNSAYRSI